MMLRVPLCVAAVGLGPALVAEVRAPLLSPALLGLLALTGGAQALYYVALARSYQAGEFSLVYPLSRALPVLLLALVELAGGRAPTALGLAGMLLIADGGALAPLPGLRAATPRAWWNRSTAWVAVIALATVAFTVVDRAALEMLPRSPAAAARYAVLPVCSLMGPPPGDFRRVMGPPQTQDHGATRGGDITLVSQGHGTTSWALFAGPWGHVRRAQRLCE